MSQIFKYLVQLSITHLPDLTSTVKTMSAMEIDEVQVSTAVLLAVNFYNDCAGSGTFELIHTENGASELSSMDVLGLDEATELFTFPYITTETSTTMELPSANKSQVLGDHIELMEFSGSSTVADKTKKNNLIPDIENFTQVMVIMAAAASPGTGSFTAVPAFYSLLHFICNASSKS